MCHPFAQTAADGVTVDLMIPGLFGPALPTVAWINDPSREAKIKSK